MKTLPDKPSKLLRLALDDLKWVESQPDYMVDMATWHSGKFRGVCSVCLAGAVMAHTLDAKIGSTHFPSHFGGDVAEKFMMLDDIRVGCYGRVFDRLDIDKPVDFPSYQTPILHSDDPQKFYEWMGGIADLFEKHGL